MDYLYYARHNAAINYLVKLPVSTVLRANKHIYLSTYVGTCTICSYKGLGQRQLYSTHKGKRRKNTKKCFGYQNFL